VNGLRERKWESTAQFYSASRAVAKSIADYSLRHLKGF
jgi:hypothetical protein